MQLYLAEYTQGLFTPRAILLLSIHPLNRSTNKAHHYPRMFPIIIAITSIFTPAAVHAAYVGYVGVPGAVVATNMMHIASLFSVEQRDCQSFNQLRVIGSIDVELSTGNTYSVQVQGDKDLLHHIDTMCSGEELLVNVQENLSKKSMNPIKVVVQIPEAAAMSMIFVDGSARFNAVSPIQVEDLHLVIQGSGKIRGTFSGKKITAQVHGRGDIKIKGACEQLVCNIHADGKINTVNVDAVSVQSTINGSGSAKVAVKNSLTCNLNDSGNLYYKGNPISMMLTTPSTGRVKKL